MPCLASIPTPFRIVPEIFISTHSFFYDRVHLQVEGGLLRAVLYLFLLLFMMRWRVADPSDATKKPPDEGGFLFSGRFQLLTR